MSTNQATFQERKQKILRTFQFLVYCWALRLAFVAIGTVLVSLFQFVVPSSKLGIQIQHIKVFGWSTVVKEDYRYLKDLSEPVLFRGLDVITPSLLKSKILRVTPIAEMKLKTSVSDYFTHFDDHRLWSKRYSSSKLHSYITTQDLVRDHGSYRIPDILQSLFSSDTAASEAPAICTDGDQVCTAVEKAAVIKRDNSKQYIYSTHSNALPYVPALSPSLAQYISLESTQPQVCLWVSSPNITAALHYDLEDNFLLQVSGTKKLIVVSPEALDKLNPHSSWHPHWRQASMRSDMRTSTQIIEHLIADEAIYTVPARCDSSTTHNSTCEDTGTSSTPAGATGATGAVTSTGAAVNSAGGMEGVQLNRGAYGEYRIWEVDLTPGSMVFIPAGYYHTVTAGDNSISLNAWFRSALSDVHAMFVNVPLPFTGKDTQQLKLTRLAVTIRQLLFKLHMSADLFAHTMGARYAVLLQHAVEGAWDRAGNPGNSMCVSSEVLSAGLIAEEGAVTANSAQRLFDILHSRPSLSLSPALVTVSLMDYVEEVLALIWGEARLNPFDAYHYATQCFAVDEVVI